MGAQGQLGQRLCQRLSGKYFSRQTCDIANIDQVRQAVRDVDWVINAASFTHVDQAETCKREAKVVNDFGVKVLAQVCAERRIALCHVSTDQIFSGYQRREHSVEDEPHPLNFFAVTKLRGERHVRRLPRHLIVRTSWVYGGSSSFVQDWLRKVRDEEVMVEGDQYSRPTFAKDLALAIETCVEASVVGTVHFANEGWCSRAEFAEEVFRMVGSEVRVQHVPSDFFQEAAPRPKFSVLQLTEFPFLCNRHWRFALAEYLREEGYRVE